MLTASKLRELDVGDAVVSIAPFRFSDEKAQFVVTAIDEAQTTYDVTGTYFGVSFVELCFTIGATGEVSVVEYEQ